MDPHARRDTFSSSPDAQSLCVRLLGEFSVSRNGRQVAASSWRFHNSRRLLQILALAAGHRIHREQINELFWPESDGRAANNSLHQVLHHARRALSSIGADGRALHLDRHVVALDVPLDSLWIDVDAFEAAAREALQSDDPDCFHDALALYAGELLPEERYADWAAPRRDALHSISLGLLLRLGELLEERGDLGGAEDAYRRLTVDDPTHEGGQAGLMRVYALTGRRHQSLAQYKLFEETIRRELDVDPGPDIADLRDRIGQGVFPYRQTAVETPPILSGGELPFVGRSRELQLLRDVVERSFAGSGSVVSLAGEPGVGKTRTAREVAAYAARSGSTVLWGRCHQDSGAPAYWPWVQVIRDAIAGMEPATLAHLMGSGASAIGQIVPEVREILPGVAPDANLGAEQARFQLFDSVARFLQQLSLRRPILIVLDDLHWADRSSLLLLSFLGEQVGRSRIAVICAYRDTETDGGGPLAVALAELSRSEVLQRLSLTGLSEAEVGKLIDGLSRSMRRDIDAARVFRRTEGNPFFVGEVLRMIRDDAALAAEDWSTVVPPGVRDVISQRLSRMTDNCNSVLDSAAVAGRVFRMNLLEQVSDRHRSEVLEALDEAIRAGLVEEMESTGGAYQFSHALVRETVYDRLGSVRKAALHQRTGAALERLHHAALDNHLNELAHHYARAAVTGDIRPALEYGLRAGDQALDRIAYSEATDHYRRTLRLLATHQPTARSERLDLLLRLGEALNHIGNREESRSTFEEAATLARNVELPHQFGRAALGYAGLGLFLTSEDQRPLLEEAAGWLPDEDSSLRAKILARLAFEVYDVAPLEDRASLCDRAEAIARRLGDSSTLIYVLIARNWTVETIDNLHERIAISEEVLGLIEESGEVTLAAPAQAMRFYDGFHLGDLDIVDRQIAVFEELAERLREPQREWLSIIFKLTRAVHLGEYAQADLLEAGARRIADGVLPPHGHDRRVISQLVEMRREQGRLHEIGWVAARELEESRSGLYWRALAAHIAGHSANGNGRAPAIASIVEQLGRTDLLDLDVIAAAALLSTTPEVLSNPELGATLLGYLTPHADRFVFARTTHQPYGPAAYYIGRLAGMLGDHALAAEHLQRAVAMNQRMGARPYLARSRYELAKVLLLRGEPGDHDVARQLLGAAQHLAVDVGMPALADEIRGSVSDA